MHHRASSRRHSHQTPLHSENTGPMPEPPLYEPAMCSSSPATRERLPIVRLDLITRLTAEDGESQVSAFSAESHRSKWTAALTAAADVASSNKAPAHNTEPSCQRRDRPWAWPSSHGAAPSAASGAPRAPGCAALKRLPCSIRGAAHRRRRESTCRQTCVLWR